MFEALYADLVRDVIQLGDVRQGRNGQTRSMFVTSLQFDLQTEFPWLQHRRMYPKGILGELAAMLRGPKHITDFEKWGCNYWKKWAKPDGSIAVDYGNAWLDFNGVNQLDQLRESLLATPTSRRMVVTGWRPGAEVDLPCCHMLYQFYVRETPQGNFLDMMWVQRSADVMIGVPSDAVFAAAWLIAICAECTWLRPGRVFMQFGDTHVYEEHVEQAVEYFKSVFSNPGKQPLVTWSCDEVTDNFCKFEPSWIGLHNINHLAPKYDFVLKD